MRRVSFVSARREKRRRDENSTRSTKTGEREESRDDEEEAEVEDECGGGRDWRSWSCVSQKKGEEREENENG